MHILIRYKHESNIHVLDIVAAHNSEIDGEVLLKRLEKAEEDGKRNAKRDMGTYSGVFLNNYEEESTESTAQ